MGDYETVISIAGFFVISHMVLVVGGGGSVFFDLPEGTTPPQLFPEPAANEIVPVDLEGEVFASENVTFVSSSDLSDPAFESDTVAVLETGSDSGTLSYNIPGVQYVETYSTDNCGGLLGDSGLQIGSGQDTTTFEYICSVEKANVAEDNVNFIEFKFDGSGDRTPRLYGLNYSEQVQQVSSQDSLTGSVATIAGFFGAIGEVLTYPLRLWDYFEHFPLYIKLFYGTILAWMAVDILQIG